MSPSAERDPLWETPIVLAATPIGNLADATDRLKQLITSAEIIACEDTRRTRHLIEGLGLSTSARLVSLHEHNEASRAAELIAKSDEATRILVVPDAGMPAVSDPGFRLVSAALEAGVAVSVAPGPSAVTTALALSGLATDRFTFAGFIPRRASDRERLFQRLRTEEWTTVLFDSPRRIAQNVTELAADLGENRNAAVARELTKRFEEVLRGSLAEIADQLRERDETGLKGEFVVVLAGASPEDFPGHQVPTVEELAGEVVQRAAAGERLKAAAKSVGGAHGVPASRLYDAAVEMRRG